MPSSVKHWHNCFRYFLSANDLSSKQITHLERSYVLGNLPGLLVTGTLTLSSQCFQWILFFYVCWYKFDNIAFDIHPLDQHSSSVLEDCEQGHFLFLNISQVYSKEFDKSSAWPVLWQRHSFQFICFSLFVWFCLECKFTVAYFEQGIAL
jgi:hypothetical protein